MAENHLLTYDDGGGATPYTVTLGPSQDIRIFSVRCKFSGTGAASAFFPTLALLSPDGKIVSRTRPETAFAAGDTGEVTYAPFLHSELVAPVGGIIPYTVFLQVLGVFDRAAVFVVPVGGGSPLQISSPGVGSLDQDMLPDASPDGSQVVFVRDVNASTTRSIRTVNSDGTGETEIASETVQVGFPTWSRDGLKIAYIRGNTPDDLVVMNPDGTGAITVATSAGGMTCFTWSRDSTQLVYSGTGGQHIVNADGTGDTIINAGGAGQISWGFQSDFLVYLRASQLRKSATDGTGEVALSSFGAGGGKNASRRLLLADDDVAYGIWQTSGAGRWQIYECPVDASGMVATDIWTSGNTGTATGTVHCYPAEDGRFYSCAFTLPVGGVREFVSYAKGGTDRRVEDPVSSVDVSLGDQQV